MPQVSSELGFRGMVLVLAVMSLVASLVVIRFGGFGGPSLWNFDSPQASFPLATFFHEALVGGRLPLWNDRLNLGLPLYAEGQIGAFYPLNWLIYQLPPIQALDLSRILHLTFAGIGTGLIVLRLAGSRSGAVTAALIAVLCGGVAGKLEWVNVIVVYSWVPWVILPLVWRRPRPTSRNVIVAGIFWGIQAIAAFPPYWVLTGILAVLLIMLRGRDMAGVRRVVVFGFFGVAVGAVQLVPTLILTSLSPRGEGLQLTNLFEYSATPFDFLGLAFANALVPAGNPAWDVNQTWYPGGFWAFLESYMFIGLPALGLGVAGLRNRRARPFAVIAIVAVAVPLIGVFQPAIWAAIPGLNGLRHPVRAYMFLDLALAIGAGFGISRLSSRRVWRTAAWVIGLVTAGYFLILGLAAAGTADVLWATVLPGQADLVRNRVVATMGSLWPLGLELLLAGFALVVFRVRRRSAALRIAAATLAILPMALLVPGINQSLPASAFSLEGRPIVTTLESFAPRAILTRNEPYYPGLSEVLGVGASPQPHIFSTQFQASLYFQATRDLIQAMRASGSDTALLRAVGIDTVVDFRDQCAGRPVTQDPQTGATICRIDDALRPPYWIPPSAVAVPDGEPRSLITPSDALIEPHGAIAHAVPALVASRDEGKSTIIVDAKTSGYVFVDRSWWPGWRVTVDSVSVTPYRALSGQLVPVQAGRHVIEERFIPWDAAVGLLFGVGALVILGAWLALDHRRRRWSLATGAIPTAGRRRTLVPLPSHKARLPVNKPVPVAAIQLLRRNQQKLAIRLGVVGVRVPWAPVGLLAIGVLLPVIIAVISGSLSIPHNDDWDYRRVAYSLYSTGHIELTGFEGKSLIGQVIFAQPFLWLSGGDPWAFAAATIVLSIIGILAGYLLVRRILPPWRAALAVLIVLLIPGLLRFSTTFMTDVPAFACEMLCLAIGAKVLDRHGPARWRWLAGSLVVGCFAFSIREFAFAAPIAVLIAAAAQDSWRRLGYWLAGAAVVATCFAILRIISSLPGYASITPLALFSLGSLVDGIHAMTTPALIMSPILVLAATWWWSRWRLVDLMAGAVVGVLLFSDSILTMVTSGPMPRLLLGNILVPVGLPNTGALPGIRPTLYIPPTWDILSAVGLIAAVFAFALGGAALGAAIRRGGVLSWRRLKRLLGSTTGLLASFTALTVGGLLAIGINPLFLDRYLWPVLLPVAAMLLLRPNVASFHLCAMVSSSPLNMSGFSLEHVELTAYRLLLFMGPEEPMYLYRVKGPGCP